MQWIVQVLYTGPMFQVILFVAFSTLLPITLRADLNDSDTKNIYVTNAGYEWLAKLENQISDLKLEE